ncbi:MAG: hypothetical protein PHS92_01105 [Candidatus Gracilibacteria bacterium]|nr:hypothetical protein [Candidatus Gracilibacteria bacterium]
MDNNQIKTNAVISYMFLGWIFLLAKSNPNFEHEFIRKHAKKATKIHLIFLMIFIVYNLFFSKYLYYSIPLVLISVDKIINLIIFAILTVSILKGCYKAHKGLDPSNVSLRKAYIDNSVNYDLKDISENEKMLYLSSLLPFLGIISSKNHENEFTKNGVKVGFILTFLIVLYYILNGFDSIFLISLFAYIFVIVYYGVNVFINNKFSFPAFIENIPNLKISYLFIKTGFLYSIDFIKLIFGKNKVLDFRSKAIMINKEDHEYDDLLRNYYTNDKLILSKKLIFFPIINLLFIPLILKDGKNRYFLAIIQGIIMSAIIIFLGISYGFKSNLEILVLFPVFLGVANIDSNPFYRIPFIYEIYKIFNLISFGFFSKIRLIKEKNKEMKEVRLKV